MEIRIKSFLAGIACALIIACVGSLAEQEFIQPKKKSLPKIKPEDCCYESLPLMGVVGRVQQALGSLQVNMTKIISEFMENDKKSALKNADQNKLHELMHKQDQLHSHLLCLEKELTTFNNYIRIFNTPAM